MNITNVAITGSNGLLGSAVAARLEGMGVQVARMVRGTKNDPRAYWNPANRWIREDALDGVDAVIHFAGASIGSERWSPERKRELRASRIDSTRLLIEHMRNRGVRPKSFISASAVGYYGDRGEEVLDESAALGDGFLASLCLDWEAEALHAKELGARVVLLRTSVVFDNRAEAFQRLVTPFRLFAGGPLGNGEQWFPWVHLQDVVGAVVHALTAELSGPLNLSASETVRNRDVAQQIGNVLSRPSLFPVPRTALRLVLGQMADELLLASQRVIPQVLIDSGYTWAYPHLDDTLQEALVTAKRADRRRVGASR